MRVVSLILKKSFYVLQFSFFNEINKLPALVQLNCRKNPVFEKEEYDTVREIVIAKIKRLKKFNNSAVSACLQYVFPRRSIPCKVIAQVTCFLPIARVEVVCF